MSKLHTLQEYSILRDAINEDDDVEYSLANCNFYSP